MKLTTNSSDVNLYAVTSLTQGNTSGCLVACGSYVSGDSGPLQSWSTSDFEIGNGPSSIISLKDQRITPFTLEHTIALPYFIEGTMCDDDRRLYENECLEHLHILCLYNKVLKKKVTCILMEITLASNIGAPCSSTRLRYCCGRDNDWWTHQGNAFHNGEAQNISKVCAVYNNGLMVEMWDGIRKQVTTNYTKQAIIATTSPWSFNWNQWQ